MRDLLIWMNGVHGDIRSLEPSYIVPLFAFQFYLFAHNSSKFSFDACVGINICPSTISQRTWVKTKGSLIIF